MQASIDVSGTVFARGEPYRCRLYVAPGQYPNNATTTDTPPGDFAPLSNGWCDGSTVHDGVDAASAHDGVIGSIDVAALRQRFPAGTDFSGPIPSASAATGNGRPFFAPHAFTFKVVVTPTTGHGADRRGPADGLAASRQRPPERIPADDRRRRAGRRTRVGRRPRTATLRPPSPTSTATIATSSSSPTPTASSTRSARTAPSCPAGRSAATSPASSPATIPRPPTRTGSAPISAAPSSARSRSATPTATGSPRSMRPTPRASSTAGAPMAGAFSPSSRTRTGRGGR